MVHRILAASLIASLFILFITSTIRAKDVDAVAKDADAKGSYRLEATILQGYSVKIEDSSDRHWGPTFGFRTGVTHDDCPIYLGTIVAAYVGGEGDTIGGYNSDGTPYPSKVHFLSLQFGAELGYELRFSDYIIRPSIGFGMIGQNGIGKVGYTEYAAYISPVFTGIWDAGVLLGLDLWPLIGLSENVQAGFIFTIDFGGLFLL